MLLLKAVYRGTCKYIVNIIISRLSMFLQEFTVLGIISQTRPIPTLIHPGIRFSENIPHLTFVTYHALHYSDVIMIAMASQITGVSIVCSTVWSDVDQRKHQSSTSPAFVREIHESQRDSNAENVSIWCRHHEVMYPCIKCAEQDRHSIILFWKWYPSF